MAGIKDYSTTNLNNTSLNGISVAEGMLPSNLNNAIRALMVNTREWYNDSQWVIYGDGDGSFTLTYASATSFTISSVDVSAIYHTGRRVKAIGSATGTIYGTISSSSFSTNTTVNVTWDSGSLSNESLTIYIGGLSKTNSSIPEGVIATATLADGSVTTIKIADSAITTAKINDSAVTNAKLGADSVNSAKIADDSIDSEHYVDGSIDTAHIANSQITTAKIADANVTTAKIADANVTNAKLATNSVTTIKITDANITTAKIADANITTAKIADSNVTTAKIEDDAVTAAKIADAVIVTNSEHSAHTPSDTTFFTTSASDARYFRQDSSETISSGDTWSASDSYVATTAAIDARVIDLVDDVGGFVPIANETSFPAANPDINDGAGTIVSVTTIGTSRTPSSGTVTIANGSGANTVTITGCGSTVLAAGYGLLIETTTTLHTYTFVRLVPKATEVTTVASISSDISTVAGEISPTNNISTVAGNAADINIVAGISADVTAVAAIDSDVTAVAGDATDIGTVATDLAGSDNIGTIAGSIANVNTAAGSISNINTVSTNIANVNTVATNIASVNNFGEVYRISATAPTTSLNSGDLYFDTTTNILNVYGASGWQNAGSSVNGTSQRYNYTATSGQTTFTGADNNGNTLAYDAGYIDVYLNGVKLLNGTDVTVTSGTSVVLASGATTGDVVDIVAYGTFSVASLNADNLDSGTVPSARLGTITNFTSTGIDDNATSTAITIDSGEKVGIGTTSPSRNLQVAGTNAVVAIKTTDDTYSSVFFGDTSADNIGKLLYDHTNDSLQTIVNNSERMRIDSSGNVGIGTSTPASLGSNIITLEITGGSTIRQGGIYLSNSDKSVKSYFYGTNGLTVLATESNIPLAFSTNNTERMRITNTGNVSIGSSGGTTSRLLIVDSKTGSEASPHISISGNGFGGYHWLDTEAYYIGQNSNARNLRLYAGSNENDGVNLSPGGNSWGSYSDERLKKDITDLTNGLDKISAMRPVNFKYKSDADDYRIRIGIIAQSLVGQVDEALDQTKRTSDDETEYYNVRYQDLIPVLVKALQEAKTKIETLEAKVTALETTN